MFVYLTFDRHQVKKMDRRGGRDRSPIGDRLKRLSGVDEDARDARDSRGPMENGFRRERQNENNEPLKIDREKVYQSCH